MWISTSWSSTSVSDSQFATSESGVTAGPAVGVSVPAWRATSVSSASLKVSAKIASLRFSSYWAPSRASRWITLVVASAARPRLSTVCSAADRAAMRTRWTALSRLAGRRGGRVWSMGQAGGSGRLRPGPGRLTALRGLFTPGLSAAIGPT